MNHPKAVCVRHPSLPQRNRTARRWIAGFLGIVLLGAPAITGGGQTLSWGANGTGGNGTWDNFGSTNWWDGNQTRTWLDPLTGQPPAGAIFGGTGGAVELDGGDPPEWGAFALLRFAADGYALDGSTLSFAQSALTLEVTAEGDSATIANDIVGASSIQKTGEGRLTLEGTNGQIGNMTVSEGALRITNAGALGIPDAPFSDAGATQVRSPEFYAVAWTGAQFLAVGTAGSGDAYGSLSAAVLASQDGLHWASHAVPAGREYLAVASSGSVHIAFGSDSTAARSTDGATWHPVALNIGLDELVAALWDGTRFVAAGSGGRIATSADGLTWSHSITQGSNSSLSGITHNGSLYVAVGDGGRVVTSPDAATWTIRTSGTSNDLHAVTWAAAISRFVAVGNFGTILISPDGASWAVQSSGNTTALNAVAASGNLVVAAGNSGVLFTSTNGTGWTARASGLGNALRGIAWSGTRFVAVGRRNDGAVTNSTPVTASSDGLTWSAQRIGGALELIGGITVANESLTIAGVGGTGEGALLNISGNNTWNGPIRIASFQSAAIGSSNGTLTIGGNTISADGIGSDLSFMGAGNTSVTASIGWTVGDVTKQGTGTLTLAGTNAYSGQTAVTAGTLQLGSSNALPAGSALTLSAGATLDLAGHNATVRNLQGSGNVIRLEADRTLVLLNQGFSANTTFSGSIAGAGQITKTGNASLTLTGNSSGFDGFIAVNDGTLVLNGNLAAGTTAQGIAVGTGSTLHIAGNTTLADAVEISGSGFAGGGALRATGNLVAVTGNITLAGPATITNNSSAASNLTLSGRVDTAGGLLTLTGAASNRSLTISGAIAGGGGFQKLGLHTLTLSAENTTTGPVSVLGGNAILTANASVTGAASVALGGSSSVNVTLTPGPNDRFGDGAPLTLTGSTLRFLPAGVGNFSETLGNVLLGGGSNTLLLGWSAGQNTTLTLGGLSRTAGALNFTGTNLGTSNSRILINGVADGTVLDPWFSFQGGAALYSANLGVTALPSHSGTLWTTPVGAPANPAADDTSLLGNKTIYSLTLGNVGAGNAVDADLMGHTLTLTSGALLKTGTDTTASLLSNGTLTAGTGAATELIVNVETARNLTISASVADNGANGTVDLIKTGPGTLTLTAAAGYTGNTIINAGTVAVSGGADRLGTAGRLVLDGGSLNLAGNHQTVGTLEGTGNVTLGNGTLTVGGSGFTLHEGVISGNGGLTLAASHSGCLTLNGSHTYSGNTTIHGGTLTLGSGNRIANASNLVLTHGTFALNGFEETIAGVSGSGGSIDLSTPGSRLNLSGNGSSTWAGNFTGNGSLYKTGGGMLNLSGNNSAYTGTLTLNDTSTNVLRLLADQALGGAGSNAAINGKSVLELSGGIAIPTDIVMSSTGATVGSPNTLRNLDGDNVLTGFLRTQSNNANSRTDLDIQSGSLRLVGNLTAGLRSYNKYGNGTLILAGHTVPSDDITIHQTAGILLLDGATGEATLNATAGTSIHISGDANYGGRQRVSGNGTDGLGVIRNLAGNNTLGSSQSGTGLTIEGDAFLRSEAGQLTLAGGYWMPTDYAINGAAPGANVTFDGAGDFYVKDAIGGNITNVTKNGAGRAVFSADHADFYDDRANSELTGQFLINGGIVTIRDLGSLGNTTAGSAANGTVVAPGAALELSYRNSGAGIFLPEHLTIGGAGPGGIGALRNIALNSNSTNFNGTVSLAGNNTWTGNVVLSENATFRSEAARLSFNGTIQAGALGLTLSGPGDFGLEKNGGGTLVQSGNLILDGPGRLFITTDNPGFTGAALVQGGAVRLKTANALGNATLIQVAAGSSLELDGANVTYANRTTTLAGSGLDGNGAIRNVSGNNTWQSPLPFTTAGGIRADAGNLTFTGPISVPGDLAFSGNGDLIPNGGFTLTGNGGLIKQGSGRLFLNAANTYSGSTEILGGFVRAQSTTALGNTTGLTVASGAALELSGSGGSFGLFPLTIAGSGNGSSGALRNTSGNNTWLGNITALSDARIRADSGTVFSINGTLSGNGTLTLDANSNSNAQIIANGPVAGNGTLLKTGPGSVTLKANNTFSGNLTLAGGRLVLSNAGTLPGIDSITIVNRTTTFQIDNVNGANLNNRLGAGTDLVLNGGTVILQGNNTAGSLDRLVLNSGNAVVTLNGTGTNTWNATGGIHRDPRGSVSFTTTGLGTTHKLFLAGQAAGVMGGWAVVGTDFATYSATNGVQALSTYNDVTLASANLTDNVRRTSVDDSSLVGFGSPAKIVNSLKFTGTGRTIDLGNVTLALTSGGLIFENNSTITRTGNGALTAGVAGVGDTLTLFSTTGTPTLSVPIVDNAGGVVRFTKTGGATLNLNATSTYTGNTAIASGNLALLVNEALPDGSPLFVAEGAGLSLLGRNETVGSLSGGGVINFTATTNTTNTFTFGADNGNATFDFGAAQIQNNNSATNNSSLVKIGGGTQTFKMLGTGGSGYYGGMTIINGTVVVDQTEAGTLDLNTTNSSPLGRGANATTTLSNGSTLRLRISGGGNISFADSSGNNRRAFVFSPTGGNLDIGAPISSGNSRLMTVTTNASSATPGVIRYASPMPNPWTPGRADLVVGPTWGGSGSLILDLSNGAMATVNQTGTLIGGELTLRGSGNETYPTTDGATSGGRLLFNGSASSAYSAGGGLFFQDVMQITNGNGPQSLVGNITVLGGSGGGNSLVGFQAASNASSTFTLGSPDAADRFRIADRATAILDLQFRHLNSGNVSILEIASRIQIDPGGTLSLRRTNSGMNATSIEIEGDLIGTGNSTADAVLDLGVDVTAAPYTPGGANFAAPDGEASLSGGDLRIQGNGTGGLRIQGTLARIHGLLDATRLSQVTGTGGYLTVAPTDGAYAIPWANEWADPDVGLRIVNSNAGGTDAAVGSGGVWSRNLLVDAAATLDATNATVGNANAAGVTLRGGTLLGQNGVDPAGITLAGGLKTLASATTATVTGPLSLGVVPRTFDVEQGAAPVDLQITGPVSAAGAVGLIKQGNGTLLLQGNNTFAGPTSVQAGTLKLAGSLAGGLDVSPGAVLAGNGSAVGTLSNAGSVNPGDGFASFAVGAFTQTATGTLTLDIGGRPGETSLWDRITSAGAAALNGALHIVFNAANNFVGVLGDTWKFLTAPSGVLGTFASTQITATGLPANTQLAIHYQSDGVELQLQSSAVDYASWASDIPFPGGLSDPDDDPDHDGLPNLVEYGLETNPLVPDADAPAVPVVGTVNISGQDYLTLTFQRPVGTQIRGDLEYHVEKSANLTGWPAGGVVLHSADTVGETATVTFRSNAAVMSGSSEFLRLRMEVVAP